VKKNLNFVIIFSFRNRPNSAAEERKMKYLTATQSLFLMYYIISTFILYSRRESFVTAAESAMSPYN